MKQATQALISLLAGGEFQMADLYTITLSDGEVVTWTGADRALSWHGNIFAAGPGLDRGQIQTKTGAEVSEFDLTLYAKDGIEVDGQPVMAFVAGGGLIGATIHLERAFLAAWNEPIVGTLITFDGLVTAIKDVTRTKATIVVSSWMILLNVNMPPNLVQPACIHTLYDSGCTLSKAAFAVTGAISAAGGTALQFGTNLGQTAGWFDQGSIAFTSGANAGVSRTVKAQDGAGNVSLILALPNVPQVGDAFTAYPGCDKTQATCASSKFNNLIHFRGFPYVPVAETAVGL